MIEIVNTGGTYNKIYNPINGELEVCSDNKIIDEIISLIPSSNIKSSGMIYKDSLFIDNSDRERLKDYIINSSNSKFIIIHGTDTMVESAKYLSNIKDKLIIFTGAMIPYSINPKEAVINFGICYGFLSANNCNGVYISMNGIIKEFDRIEKDKTIGMFVEISDS
jgi:L-asparaginase